MTKGRKAFEDLYGSPTDIDEVWRDRDRSNNGVINLACQLGERTKHEQERKDRAVEFVIGVTMGACIGMALFGIFFF